MGDVPADDIPEGAIKITYWCVFPRTELPRNCSDFWSLPSVSSG